MMPAATAAAPAVTIYQSQRVAYPYFVVALLLFGLQLVLGLWLAFNYFFTVPQAIVDVFPFSTARAMHTNLLVLWLLLGFMGATFYMVPEETQSELAWPKLAIVQLVILPSPAWSPRSWGSSSAGRRGGRSSRSRGRSTSSSSSAR